MGMMDRLLSFLVALSLACLLWLYARSRDPETLDNVPVPVQIALEPGLDENYDLEVNGASHVPVSFQGPRSRIRDLRELLQRGAVRVAIAVSVPPDRRRELRYSDSVRIDAADIHAPPGVTPLIVEGRNRIPIVLRRLGQRRLLVRLEPATDDRVKQVVVEPAAVLVRGPKVILDGLRNIPTQPLLPPAASETASDRESVVSTSVSLVRELEGRPVTTLPAEVSVRLTVRPQEKVYDLKGIPIRCLCPPDFPLRVEFPLDSPRDISLRLRGPADKAPQGVVAYVDLSQSKYQAGAYGDEPLRLELPSDFTLAQQPPRSPPFRLIPVPRTEEGTEAVDEP
jgi:hypothetical protein